MKKARQRLDALIDEARVLVLASHNEGLLKRICNQIVEMDAGRTAARAILRPSWGSGVERDTAPIGPGADAAGPAKEALDTPVVTAV